MLVELKINKDLVNDWNENLDRCIREYKDPDGYFESQRIKEDHKDSDIFFPLNMDEEFPDAPKGFVIAGLNFTFQIKAISNVKIINEFNDFMPDKSDKVQDWSNTRANYGVCDDEQQILKRYPELITSDKKFVVIITPIHKEGQPEQGGWRWHKWGSYIGIQNSQSEYIYDEPEIDRVLLFHIYSVEMI